jgi:protein involved in polysaccharide export with SLBB domain
MTLYSAIQGAGGETPYAAMNRVKLYRNGQAYVYDMKRQDHKGVKIYSRDVIEVPEGNLIGR